MTSIFNYGCDVTLVQTRQLVLQRPGFDVIVAFHLSAVQQALSCEKIDLFILCHSLTGEECGAVVAMVRSSRPELRILFLSLHLSEEYGTATDYVLAPITAPKRLIEVVDALTCNA